MPGRPAPERRRAMVESSGRKIDERVGWRATELQQSFKYGSNLWPNERAHDRLTALAILNDDEPRARCRKATRPS
jgi:hypothetical protein